MSLVIEAHLAIRGFRAIVTERSGLVFGRTMLLCPDSLRSLRPPVQVLWAIWLASLAGCWSPSSDLVPVSGEVTLSGKPLTTGTVSLRPDSARGNTSQHQPTGRIDPQGRYTIYTTEQSGAPPGWYKVVVFASSQTDNQGKAHPGMPQSIIDVRYNDPTKTPLAIEVKAGQPAAAYALKLE
jgi:hypothetical protein